MQKSVFSSIVACLTLLAATTQASETAVHLLRGPYLQQSTSESIVIVWRLGQLVNPSVRYGEDPENLDLLENKQVALRIAPVVKEIPKTKRLYSRLHSAADDTYQYEMTLTGLKPNTKYHYAVYADDVQIDAPSTLTFNTHPIKGTNTPIRIWAVGDSGTGGEDQAAVYQAALKTIQRDGIPLSMYIHVGDMAYTNGKEDEFQKGYFDVYQPTLSATVCWPAMGNHEGHTSSGRTADGPYYDAYVCPTQGEAGGIPSGTEAYYSFDYGTAHFICLDSHDLDRHEDGVMANWLKRDLAATDSEWLIAFWHHPPYTKGSHDSDLEQQLIEMREQIMPIMEAHGVDLVLTGHSHVYERSMLIDKAYDTPTTNDGVVLDDGNGHIHEDGAYHKGHGLNPHQGVTQIVTGHGGARISRRGVIPIMRHTIVEHGSVLIDIENDTLTARMIDKLGNERDQFSIVKKGKVHPKIVKNPWDPTGPSATPSGGPIPNDFTVTLTPVRYWENSDIHYTLDGSEPTLDSPLYNGNLVVPQDTDLVFIKSRSFNGETIQPSVTSDTILKKYGPAIPKAKSQIKIDGDLNDWASWTGKPFVMGAKEHVVKGSGWNGTNDLSAQAMCSWTTKGLLMAFTVLDDDFNPSLDSELFNYDCIQIMIDGRPFEEQVNASLTTGAYNLLVSQSDELNETVVITSNEQLSGCESAIQIQENGYTLEVFIPFSKEAFPFQNFETGRSLQLALKVMDRDIREGNAHIKQMAWGAIMNQNNFRNASFWKPLKLGE